MLGARRRFCNNSENIVTLRQNKGVHYLHELRTHYAFRVVYSSGASCGSLFLQEMTRVERLERELEKLYSYRQAAMRAHDLFWLSANNGKIQEKERELIEARRYQPMKLADVLDDKGQDVKNSVYKALLKISLAADFANECSEEAKALMSRLDLNDFSLRSDVEELCRLSQKIASFVIIPNQNVLTDMMCDNADFIDTCNSAADSHLNDKLKL